ncbi:nucleotidyltransferase family protein [Paraneptunicella aestuarii]|nr:nucleotidyltransferase family protein [Paraneptunicella aestuarii]
MILAAGRGERMRPLTDTIPKPLLEVAGKSLLQWHLDKLVAAGIKRVVINLHWLGEKIEQALGNGSQFGVELVYSKENPVLETAGGIANALPLLNLADSEAFLVVNGDVWSDIDYALLCQQANERLGSDDKACLVMVDNPEHHPEGDFVLYHDRLIQHADASNARLTYSGMGVFKPHLFTDLAIEPVPLGPILRQAICNDQLAAIHHQGRWSDVGTPERLQQLDKQLRAGE